MSSSPISEEDIHEAYTVAVLKEHESSLARCYLQLHRTASRVTSFDWTSSDQGAMAAIDALRKIVSFNTV